tara:strand:- start:1948 stop:2898 length:951 start_codon:yes stop_codon:yes gene_type:complete
MSYLGNSLDNQQFTPTVDYFNGNASTTSFTLSKVVGSVYDIQVVIENVPQNPASAFTIAGNVITFTSAPPSGTNNIYVRYTSPVTQLIKPAQGTVSNTEISSAFSLWNLSGANVSYSAGNVGIGITSPTAKLHVYGDSNNQFKVQSSGAEANFTLAGTSYGQINNDVGDFYITNGSAGGSVFLRTASTTQVTVTVAGDFRFNSGYGSAATAYGCRLWVNFNGTGTVAIRGSGNITSISDNGTGDYSIFFTNNMPDNNYSVCLSGMRDADNNGSLNTTLLRSSVYGNTVSTGNIRILAENDSGTRVDPLMYSVAVFR